VPHGIFVGISTVDVVYLVDDFPAANTKIAARSQDLFAGGPATNAAIAFQHLGGQATLVSAVGRHVLTSAITAELERYGIAHRDLSPAFEGVPPIASITVNPAGERNVVSARAVRVAPPPAQVDESLLAQASIVLVDGHPMQACQVWARAARAREIPVVLDGGSWKDGTRELLASIDTVICSADFRPPSCFSEDDVIDYLRDCGVAHIAITHGAEPVRFVSGATSGLLPVPQVEPVDTMGAGDIFHGAFCYYAATGHGFEQGLREAAKVAAESCRFRGTREWMKQGNVKQTARDSSASPAA
jgi:sugar/nucleoside kinase (ribokinase family)